MVYDEYQAAVLLYNVNGNVPETWSWDGAQWTLKASGSSNPEPSRSSAVMASDPASGRVVMFGGASQAGGNMNAMWSWTGQGWTKLGTDAPLRVLGASAVADIDRHALLGYQDPQVLPPIPPGAVVVPAQTWAWDGVRWMQLHPQHEPTVSASGLFADPRNHRILLVGTNVGHGYGKVIEIWAWSGDDWKQLA